MEASPPICRGGAACPRLPTPALAAAAGQRAAGGRRGSALDRDTEYYGPSDGSRYGAGGTLGSQAVETRKEMPGMAREGRRAPAKLAKPPTHSTHARAMRTPRQGKCGSVALGATYGRVSAVDVADPSCCGPRRSARTDADTSCLLRKCTHFTPASL
jgi:hypothetical protein